MKVFNKSNDFTKRPLAGGAITLRVSGITELPGINGGPDRIMVLSADEALQFVARLLDVSQSSTSKVAS